MRRISRIVPLLLLSGFLIFAQSTPATIPNFGPTNELYWDPVTTDVLGNPEAWINYVVGVFKASDDPRIADSTAVPVWTIQTGNAVTLAMSGICDALTSLGFRGGDCFRFFVLAIDQNGIESGWSDPWEGTFAPIPPIPPVPPMKPQHVGCR